MAPAWILCFMYLAFAGLNRSFSIGYIHYPEEV